VGMKKLAKNTQPRRHKHFFALPFFFDKKVTKNQDKKIQSIFRIKKLLSIYESINLSPYYKSIWRNVS